MESAQGNFIGSSLSPSLAELASNYWHQHRFRISKVPTVFAVITQTPRFRAAIEDSGFANALTQCGAFTEDGNLHQAQSNPRGESQSWRHAMDRSREVHRELPGLIFDRIDTPLLMIHGTEDTAVRVNNADEAFTYLRRLGKTVEYARYRGDGHKFLLYANCVDRAERILRFLDEQLDIARDEAGPVIWEGGRAAPRWRAQSSRFPPKRASGGWWPIDTNGVR